MIFELVIYLSIATVDIGTPTTTVADIICHDLSCLLWDRWWHILTKWESIDCHFYYGAKLLKLSLV